MTRLVLRARATKYIAEFKDDCSVVVVISLSLMSGFIFNLHRNLHCHERDFKWAITTLGVIPNAQKRGFSNFERTETRLAVIPCDSECAKVKKKNVPADSECAKTRFGGDKL